jgi:preprotein translocase subunit SecG
MNEKVPISDSADPPKDPVEVKNENIFLKETKAHTEIPAIKRASIILIILIAVITLTLMFLSGNHDNSHTFKDSEQQIQEKKKEPDTHPKEP